MKHEIHTRCRASRSVKQSSGLQKDYKFKFKYFIASYTWQGVYRGSCNKVSHTHTHENLTKHNITKKLCWHYIAYGWLSAVNSLAPGRFQWNFRWIIFKILLEIGGWGISYEIALTWISLYLTDDKSTLVQVMTWCPQAASHYVNNCRPRSMSTCGVPGPQWVNNFFYYFHIVFLIISHHNTLS